jgi:hypothetical protein
MATNDSGKTGALGGNTAAAAPAQGGLGTGTAGDPAAPAPAAPAATTAAAPAATTAPGQPAHAATTAAAAGARVDPPAQPPAQPKGADHVARTEGNRPGGAPPEASAGNADLHRRAAEDAMHALSVAHPAPPGSARELAALAKSMAEQALRLATQALGAEPGQARVSGIPGGPFTIDGTRLSTGSEPTVTFAGERVKVTSHNAQRVKGQLPANVRSGEVVVDPGGGAPAVRAQFSGGLTGEQAEKAYVAPPPSSQMTQAEKDAQAKAEAEDLAQRRTEAGGEAGGKQQ